MSHSPCIFLLYTALVNSQSLLHYLTYAYSNYEFDKLDNVVKIVNLPDICSVNIYTVSGTLVRTYNKDSPVTSIDWDLKNYAGIPISSGVYLIHIKVPGVCEKVLKWFGVIRPPDLDSF